MVNSRARLAFYAFSHFAVDLCCFIALYSGAVGSARAALWVLVYNALAFGLQTPLGALADGFDDVRPLAALGLGLVALGTLAQGRFLACVLLLGVGNALFHVSGAVATLRDRPGDALRAGVYVAPGALGVACGILSAGPDGLSRAMCVLLLLVCVLTILAVGPGAPRGVAVRETPREPLPLGAGALMLCLAAVGVRSFAGFSADLPKLLFLGALASFAGKLLGGMAGRKLGWNALSLLCVGVGGLIMAFFPGARIIYVGVLLFNFAMPLTLAAVMKSLPGHAGLGFGLTTLALLLGWLPLVSLETGYDAPKYLMAGLTLAAALVLFLIFKYKKPDPVIQEEKDHDAAS